MRRRGSSEVQGIALVAAGALVLIAAVVIVVLYAARSPAGPPRATQQAETAPEPEPQPQPESAPTVGSGQPGEEPFAPMGVGAAGLTPVSPSALGDGGAPVGFAVKRKAQSIAGRASEGAEDAEREANP